MQTTVFLNRLLKSEPEFNRCRTVRDQPELGIRDISSSLKWVVNSALQIMEADMANYSSLIQFPATSTSQHGTGSVAPSLISSSACTKT